jgi:hypothetical protein
MLIASMQSLNNENSKLKDKDNFNINEISKLQSMLKHNEKVRRRVYLFFLFMVIS